MAEEKKSALRTYLGCGCGLVVLVVMVVLAGGSYYAYRKAEQWKTDLADPLLRAERVRSILGAEELPEGLYPAAYMDIPWLMEMAMLSDVEPPAQIDPEKIDEVDFERRSVYFMNISNFKGEKKERDLADFFDGRTRSAEAMRNVSVDLEDSVEIARGRFQLQQADVRYFAQRGTYRLGAKSNYHVAGVDVEVDTGGGESSTAEGVAADSDAAEAGRSRRPRHGITAMAYADCPDDHRLRIFILFGHDPSPETELEELELVGTFGDEETIRELLDHFVLCF